MSDQTSDQKGDAPETDDEHRPAAGFAAKGATGAVAAGLGVAAVGSEVTVAGEVTAAAAAGFGPAGVPLAPGAAVGPAGVPFDAGAMSGPAGVPLGQGVAGPTGVPLGQGAAGPIGVPINPTGIIRAHRVPFIAGAAVVAALAVGATVLASRNDNPPARPAAAVTATSGAVVVEATATTDAPATVVEIVAGSNVPVTAPTTTEAATTTTAVPLPSAAGLYNIIRSGYVYIDDGVGGSTVAPSSGTFELAGACDGRGPCAAAMVVADHQCCAVSADPNGILEVSKNGTGTWTATFDVNSDPAFVCQRQTNTVTATFHDGTLEGTYVLNIPSGGTAQCPQVDVSFTFAGSLVAVGAPTDTAPVNSTVASQSPHTT